MLRNLTLTLFVLFCSAGAFAQGGTTSILHVYINDPNCAAVTKVQAVMQDNDRRVIADATRQTDRCHWVVKTDPDLFPSARTHFSLRLAGLRARTPCRIPSWNDNGYAVIKFDLLTPVRKVTFTPLPEMDLPYVRDVPKYNPAVDQECGESGILGVFGSKDSKWTVEEVDIDHERLRLRYIESKKDVCGLVVSSIQRVKKAMKQQEGEITLPHDDISDALASQRKGDSRCHAPVLGGTGIEISERNLEHRPLYQLTIGWE